MTEPEDDKLDEDDEEDAGCRRDRLPDRFVRLLQQRRAELARIPVDPDLPLVRNIGWLAELLDLSQAEQAVLCFALFLEGIAPSIRPSPSSRRSRAPHCCTSCWRG